MQWVIYNLCSKLVRFEYEFKLVVREKAIYKGVYNDYRR